MKMKGGHPVYITGDCVIRIQKAIERRRVSREWRREKRSEKSTFVVLSFLRGVRKQKTFLLAANQGSLTKLDGVNYLRKEPSSCLVVIIFPSPSSDFVIGKNSTKK